MNHNLFSIAMIDNRSRILYQSENFKNIFPNNIILYESPILKKYQNILSLYDQKVIKYSEVHKILLINICNQNYVLIKSPLPITTEKNAIHMIVEEFKICNFNYNNNNIKKILATIPNKFKDINNYSTFQKEIIFALLLNKQNDKSIANFINSKKSSNISHKSINNAIGLIYKKLFVSDRDSLVAICCSLNFNKHIPVSLYKPGIYDINEFLV